MKITWFGTASLAIEDGETRLLLDPFTRMNPKLPRIRIEDFTGYDHLLLTHWHFDHLADVPAVLRADKNVPVYCTDTPKKTLLSLGADESRIHRIAPGDTFRAGSFQVTVRAGRHIDFDMKYILSVVPQCVLRFPRMFRLLGLIKKLPENGETVIFEIRAENKTVLVMGSYGVADGETYPENADLMVFPFSGNTGIADLARGTLKRLKPQRLFFDHFDDSFPPLTKRMDVEAYCEIIKKDFPGTETVIPKEREAYEF